MGLSVDAQIITERLDGKWYGHRGLACCPAHDDRSPSLSIADGDNGPLVHCFAGCEQMAVIQALRKRGLLPAATHGQRRRYNITKRQHDLRFERTIINIALFDLKRGIQLTANDQRRVELAIKRIEGTIHGLRKYT